MGELMTWTVQRDAAPLVPERECPKADTYFDGTRWRCRACTWTSPREEAHRG